MMSGSEVSGRSLQSNHGSPHRLVCCIVVEIFTGSAQWVMRLDSVSRESRVRGFPNLFMGDVDEGRIPRGYFMTRCDDMSGETGSVPYSSSVSQKAQTPIK